jgi:hypothetical protein
MLLAKSSLLNPRFLLLALLHLWLSNRPLLPLECRQEALFLLWVAALHQTFKHYYQAFPVAEQQTQQFVHRVNNN